MGSSPNTAPLCFAARGSTSFSLRSLHNNEIDFIFKEITEAAKGNACRSFTFSNDGKYFAYCDCIKTHVIDVDQRQVVLSVELPKTTQMCFSPTSAIFCTWEPYVLYGGSNPTNAVPDPNLRLWDTKTGDLMATIIQKRLSDWKPQWTEDESVSVRLLGSEVMIYKNRDYMRYADKFVLSKIADFLISTGLPPYHIACYIPPLNGQAAAVQLKSLEAPYSTISNKTFWKADRVQFEWNKKGSAVIVMAITDVDSTGKSYYGESNLYLVLMNGESYSIPLSRQGPVYSLDWHPNSTEFCVVYGYMPAKATLYNQKGESQFDFGLGPRNEVHYNSFGNLLLICGFGNLAGNMEFWSTKERKLVSKMQIPNTTQFGWCPDGQHFFTATTTPRLRQDNGYRIWHYTGRLIHEELCATGIELWELKWRPDNALNKPFQLEQLSAEQMAQVGSTVFGVRKEGATNGNLPAGAINKGGAYVPPHMRKGGGPIGAQLLEENPKKGSARIVSVESNNKAKQPVVKMDENTKKIKSIERKLEDIQKLKAKQEAGETLELNQVVKIQKEDELNEELRKLQL